MPFKPVLLAVLAYFTLGLGGSIILSGDLSTNTLLVNGLAYLLLIHPTVGNRHTLVVLFFILNLVINLIFNLGVLLSFALAILNLAIYEFNSYLTINFFSKYLKDVSIKGVFIISALYIGGISPINSLLIETLFTQVQTNVLSFREIWLSHIFSFILLIIPLFFIRRSSYSKLYNFDHFKKLSLLLSLGVVFTSCILHFVPFPYVYVLIFFSIVALYNNFIVTTYVTLISNFLSHAIVFTFPVIKPEWSSEASIYSVLISISMSCFFPLLLGVSIRQIRIDQYELNRVSERFTLASQSMELGVWEWDVRTNQLHWDERMFDLYDEKHSGNTVPYSTWRNKVHPHDIDRVEAEVSNMIEQDNPFDSKFRVVHDNGDVKWIVATAVTTKNENGEVLRVVGLNWDCSELKQTELELENAKNSLRAVIDAAEGFSIITTDLEGVIQVFSHGSEKMLGYQAEEIEGQTTPIIFHVMDEIIEKGKQLSKEEGKEISGFETFVYKANQGVIDKNKWTYIHKNGHQVPIRLIVTAIKDSEGAVTGYLGVAQDISEELAYQKTIKEALEQINNQAIAAGEAKKKFETLFSMAPEALLVVNKKGIITQANVRSHEVFDYQSDELIGVSVDDLVPEAFRGHHKSLREGYIQSPVERIMAPTLRIQGQRRNGEKIDLEINLTTITVDKEIETIVTIHDITLQRKTQDLLKEAAEKAEAVSKAKSEFVASMSHEIRTPMNAVLASSQLLKNTELDKNQSRYVKMISSAGNALLGILNDILDFSKIEAGKFELQNSEFDINELCQSLASIMSPNADYKGLEFVIGVDSKLPCSMLGDGPRLQQVLINLIGNAIKFTEKGEVFLEISQELIKENKVRVRFSVKDSGIGIEKNHQSKLFDSFSQVDGSNTRKFGGTGLGLTISQKLINMMGGQIKVNSELGKGSEFYFYLEFESSCEYPVFQEKIGEIKFIVVEDNDHSREYVCRYLDAWEYEYSCFNDLEGIETNIEDQTYFIIDWSLSGDVLGFLKSLSQDVISRTFLMVSSKDYEDFKSQSNLNIAGIIHKPILNSHLYDALMSVLAPNMKKENAVKKLKDQPLEGYNILLVEDNALNQVVASELLNDMGAKVKIANNGQESLDILQENRKKYSVVLMDVQMPIMDGFTATGKIRTELHLDIPIIAMTAGVMEKERQQCIDAGMDDFIAKPIDVDKMLQVIQANILH